MRPDRYRFRPDAPLIHAAVAAAPPVNRAVTVRLECDPTTGIPITVRRAADPSAFTVLIPFDQFNRVVAGLPGAIRELCGRK